MNKQRRKDIDKLNARIEEAKTLVATLVEDLESVIDDEQEYLDNMPESFQDGERGEVARDAIQNLESARDMLDDIDFDDITSTLEEAKA